MYIERVQTSPLGTEGEVLFFPGQIFRPTGTIQRAIFPDKIRLARHRLMIPDQSIEATQIPSPETQPSILQQTSDGLHDLFAKAVFQKNGILAGTCLRLLPEVDGSADTKIDPPVASSIKKAAIDQVIQRDKLGHIFNDASYGDDFSRVYALANLRQVTGSLETGDVEADQKIREQFNYLNGQLFYLNRAGGTDGVLQSLTLAVKLNQAFPEQAGQIDVRDVHYPTGGVMKGHALEIAEKYLQRAIKGQLFNSALVKEGRLAIIPNRPNITELHPIYQTELVSDYQVSLGSNALAAVSILRFLAEFDPGFFQADSFDQSVLEQAQNDLVSFKKEHPDALNDPNMLLLFGEHLANLQVVQKSLTKLDSGHILQFKSA